VIEYHGPHRKLYRVRAGMGLGVCHGIAEYFDLPVWLVQLGALFLCAATKIWPFIIFYAIAALLMKPKPDLEPRYAEGPEPQGFAPSRRTASWDDVKRTVASLDRRIQRMENVVTSREYDWDRRLNT
jgi:phage shock protein C